MIKEKRLSISLCIVFIMSLFASLSTAFAARNGTFTAADMEDFNDTFHGIHLYLDDEHQISLNQYTSGSPVNGTAITTWHTNADETQLWEFRQVYLPGIGGVVLILPNSNRNVAVNVVRASTSTSLTANLYPQIGNYYNDTVFDLKLIKSGGVSIAESWNKFEISAPARTTNGVTYPKLYLHMSSLATPVADGYGTSKYVKFETVSSPIIMPYATG